MKSIESPKLKFIDNDLEIDFEVEIYGEAPDCKINPEETAEEIALGLGEINERLSSNEEIIDARNKEIDRLSNSADRLDYIVAVGSGVLAGIVDSLWVGQFDFRRGKAWSNKTANEYVMNAAKLTGYDGDRLDGAIRHLEKMFRVPQDNIWKGKDLGISAKSHHLDDLAHHPTPVGLFCSILIQFTKEGYFQNSEGQFFAISIEEKDGSLIGADIPNKIFAGTINWFFHLVSDMSGSNKTSGVGMGIPGPIVALLKEMSILPGLNKTELAKKVKAIFVKEKFDLRSEMAVGHELARQAVPVMMNEVIVRAFYFIRRLLIEINEKKSFEKIEWKKTLPWNNRTIARMLTIATGTFTLVDLADAAVRGYIKSGGSGVDLKEFILRVNFVGVGRFSIAVATDVSMGINRENRRNERMAIFSEQLHLMNAKVYYLHADAWIAAEKTTKTLDEAVVIMERLAAIFVESRKANRISMKQIGEYRNGIALNNQGLIEEIVNDLKL